MLYGVRVPKFQLVGMVMMALCVSLISFQHLIFGHQEGTSLGIDGIVIDKPEGSQPILVVLLNHGTFGDGIEISFCKGQEKPD